MHDAVRDAVRAGWVVLLVIGAGCGAGSSEEDAPASTRVEVAWSTEGDAARGRGLFESLECGRCHARSDVAATLAARDCAGCHRSIRDGTYAREGVTPAILADFRADLRSLLEVPSLDALDGRLSRDWIASYLLAPHDLRPGLRETMPRLPLDARAAADLATFLVPSPPPSHPPVVADPAAVERGRELTLRLGCPSCHALGDLWPAPASGPAAAPDLRFARERMHERAIARLVRDPRALRPDATMPTLPMTERDADDLAAFVVRVELAPIVSTERPARLPLLERAVTFDEVQERVLRRSCWHCHADETLAYGDGGPGNTGGFGFAPREVDVSSYPQLMAGGLDASGQRASLFREVDGEPLLLRVLLARQDEERGVVSDQVRGMPLGLPALDAEQVQLVESWIAQGRPR